MSSQKEAQRKTWDMLEGPRLLAGMGTPSDPPGRAKKVSWEREALAFLLRLLSP